MNLSLALIVTAVSSLGYLLLQSLVQASFLRIYALIFLTLVILYFYFLLQTSQILFLQGNIQKLSKSLKRSFGRYLILIIVEGIALGIWYGLYALVFKLLPSQGVNVFFQFLTMLGILLGNSFNRSWMINWQKNL